MQVQGLIALLWLAAVKVLDVPVPMRDGVRLSTNVFRPAERAQVPVILIRTPYGKRGEIAPAYAPFLQAGYAVVVQDVRGRFQSEGTFDPLRQEPEDGYDTLSWIARQAWCNGRIGMLGGSYLGIVQWKVAPLNHPNLRCIFPWVSGWDDYEDRFYSTGGAMKLGQRLLWMADNLRVPGYKPDLSSLLLRLPLRTADVAATGQVSDMYQEALRHPSYDDFWRRVSTRQKIGRVRVPVFSVGGWYDNFVAGDLAAFAALRAQSGEHRILIGPWSHNISAPSPEFGPQARVALRGPQLEWFERWLKGKARGAAGPPVRVFVMGVNRWRDEREWPLARARGMAHYLDGLGKANTLHGDGLLTTKPPKRAAADVYTYDPHDPAPTRGGPVCCNVKFLPPGPLDQREVESRPDVLVYTSPPLRKDLEVTGPVKLVLYASTSAPDTDFTGKLVDVFPNGEARILTDGILRLRYREGLDRPAPARPGEVHRLAIDLGVTSNVFRKAHRIRLEVSSSNFPRFDRNPNTGRPVAEETHLERAQQTVFHGPERASHLLLPVIE